MNIPVAFLAKGDAVVNIKPEFWVIRIRLNMMSIQLPTVLSATLAYKAVPLINRIAPIRVFPRKPPNLIFWPLHIAVSTMVFALVINIPLHNEPDCFFAFQIKLRLNIIKSISHYAFKQFAYAFVRLLAKKLMPVSRNLDVIPVPVPA